MASPIGIEPTAYRLGGDRSILLSYEDKKEIRKRNSWHKFLFYFIILFEKKQAEVLIV